MIILIIIFLASILFLFAMVYTRAWQIKTNKIELSSTQNRSLLPKIYFRHVEKIMLYLTKHIVQWIILVVVKYWFIFETKAKKWIHENSPKISKLFGKKETINKPERKTFLQKAILESKFKIKHMKERIAKEIEEEK